MENTNDWISLKKREPKKQEPVIIYSPEPQYGILYNYRLVKNYNGMRGNNFFEPIRSGYSCIRTVTHWRPLLKPPRKED